MAKFGLKKQGRAWGLFHGTETVTGGAGVMPWDVGRRPDSPEDTKDLAADPEQLAYDNDAEYRNLRAALAEAREQPRLESPEEERVRERLQYELEERVAAFDWKHRQGPTIHWDAKAEEELDGLMHSLNQLLRQVGLSMHHG